MNEGLGYAQVVLNLLIGFYYNVIIAYSLYYLGYSIRTEVPWKSCTGEPDCFVRHNLSSDCEQEKNEFFARNSTKFPFSKKSICLLLLSFI